MNRNKGGFSDEEMINYIKVSEDEDDNNAVEIPSEMDGTLLLSTLVAQFPGACGLKYRHPDSKSVRGIRLSDGKLHPPSEAGWGKRLYICVFPKENKRKIEDVSPENSAAKTKRLEKKQTCSDLICLGLPWKATDDSVRQYFEQFGEVVMVQLKRDKSGTFKGFGFVRFATYASQMRALAQRHMIDGRLVDVRIPNSKEGVVPQMPCKVFVGRRTEDMSAEDLREYFSKFGEVTDVFVPNPFRAFAFVTFLDPEVAHNLFGEDHIIKGASVSVSSADPQIKSKRTQLLSHGSSNSGNSNQSGPSGSSKNEGGGRTGNIDTLNMQNLGINPNGGPPANFNLPIGLVAAALNQAGWGGFLGGPNNNSNNWQGGPPQSNDEKNWNGPNQSWNQNGPPQSWNQGSNPGSNRKSGSNWNNQGNYPSEQNWSGNGGQGGNSGGASKSQM